MTTIEDHLTVIETHLVAALDGEDPPSVRDAGTGAVLVSLLALTSPATEQGAARLGLLAGRVLLRRLRSSLQAERHAAIQLERQRLR